MTSYTPSTGQVPGGNESPPFCTNTKRQKTTVCTTDESGNVLPVPVVQRHRKDCSPGLRLAWLPIRNRAADPGQAGNCVSCLHGLAERIILTLKIRHAGFCDEPGVFIQPDDIHINFLPLFKIKIRQDPCQHLFMDVIHVRNNDFIRTPYRTDTTIGLRKKHRLLDMTFNTWRGRNESGNFDKAFSPAKFIIKDSAERSLIVANHHVCPANQRPGTRLPQRKIHDQARKNHKTDQSDCGNGLTKACFRGCLLSMTLVQ